MTRFKAAWHCLIGRSVCYKMKLVVDYSRHKVVLVGKTKDCFTTIADSEFHGRNRAQAEMVNRGLVFTDRFL